MWLIDEQIGRSLAEARRNGMAVSPEQHRDFAARHAPAAAAGDPRNMSRAGSTVEVVVDGVLSEKPDLFAYYYGGGNTTYESIARSLSIAASDPSVKEVVLRVNSPGGTVDGLWDALAAIESFKNDSGKSIRVVASKAQSAAYAIAALAGNITAVSPASFFGSIGTAIDFAFWSDVRTVSITNTESPDKRPDPETTEGRAVFEKFLDAVNELFVDAIARGRGVDASVVIENYGRGASFVAGEAKKRGMIDAAPKPGGKASTPRNEGLPAPGAGAHTENEMDLKTLRAQHPEAYAAAVAEGHKEERDRVVAHLTAGEMSGDMKTAGEAIRNGEAMTMTLQMKYMMAGRDTATRADRQAETDAAARAVDNAKAEPMKGKPTPMDLACQAMEKRRNGAIGGAQ